MQHKHYFAFPAPQSMETNVEELLRRMEAGRKEGNNELMTAIANDLLDEVINVLLLNFLDRMPMSGMVPSIIKNFAGVIKGTVHVLIKQVVGKLKPGESVQMAHLIADRRLRHLHNGVERDMIAIPLSGALRVKFKTSLEAALQGHGRREHLILQEAMLEFSDVAYQFLYVDLTSFVELGFILRKAVDMGGGTINKGAHSTIRKIIPTLNDEELKEFAAYFNQYMVDIDE